MRCDGSGRTCWPVRDRPVLYLDIDDTIVSYAAGHPVAARGARAFLLWALRRFEVRWLSRWCPDGLLSRSLAKDLATMTGLPLPIIRGIPGSAWGPGRSKLNGIAWLEHLVMERSFLWVEDDTGFGSFERSVLADHGLLARYHCCNVTDEPDALRRLHRRLAGDARRPAR